MSADAARLTNDGSAALGSSISIKGSVVSGEDLYFDGELEGFIEAAGSTVTVGPNAKLAASIKARKVVILGSVLGPIMALDNIEVRKTGKLAGDLITSRISIEDGAYFKGSIDICRRAKQAPSPSETRDLEERYSKLVDLKYLRGLTASEEAEFESLSATFALLDASFYGPLLTRLAHAGETRQKAGSTISG